VFRNRIGAEGIKEYGIVRSADLFDEVAAVGNVYAQARVFAKAQVVFCRIGDFGIDVDRVDFGVGIMPAQEGQGWCCRRVRGSGSACVRCTGRVR